MTTTYEEYRPRLARAERATDVEVRLAGRDDIERIAALSAERSGRDVGASVSRVTSELDGGGGGHAIMVAVRHAQVVGFGRIRNVGPDEAARHHPAPAGWYMLGLVVDRHLRRMGIGTGLSLARFAWLKERGAMEAHSLVSSQNPTSIDFHASLGFEVVRVGPGFLDVSFDCGKGYLMRRCL
ncbi:MAG: GNAT family N-acetyltransferase [Deltaproteobacteria bacterium]|nr:GNAT family N-acetyltransferase [Deltaproteobacteria bacterium]